MTINRLSVVAYLVVTVSVNAGYCEYALVVIGWIRIAGHVPQYEFICIDHGPSAVLIKFISTSSCFRYVITEDPEVIASLLLARPFWLRIL